MISLSSRDGEAEAQDYTVYIKIVGFEQSQAHNIENLSGLSFCQMVCFAVSHCRVCKTPILWKLKNKHSVYLVAEQTF